MQGRPNFTMVDRESNGLYPSPRSTDFTIKDRRSSGLQWNAEVENSPKTWENCSRTCFTQENSRLRSRKSSTDSINSEQNRDMVTGAKLTPHVVPEFLTGRPMHSRAPCNDKILTTMSLRTQSPRSLRPQHQLFLLIPLTVLQKY